ncbi:phage tail protein [Anianabacter salinae]|uniref:phage tail protein n=1 Tax=Anianabacter salinae TaxID=2851023 RepID=UPI00225E479E|nr:tail fiber protein [Anianabacter salinae]
MATVMIFGGNFAPRGWMFCDGQLLPISTYSALFSLLGTTYGGDGVTTFALPDLRGRVPIGPRHGPGLSDYREGQKGGIEHVTLTAIEMPSHTHTLHAETAAADQKNPQDKMLALPAEPIYAAVQPQNDRVMATQSIGMTGGSQAHENRQPYLAINYIIAVQGIYPSRS